ncbi:MAG TPA: FAD-binding oxidoreductase, partial [Actinomycetota bacterium]
GPLSGVVAAMARVRLPVETVRRSKLVFAELPDVPPDAPMTIDDDTGTHWRPFLRGAAVLCTDPATEPSPPAEEVPLDHGFPFAVLDPSSSLAAARIVPFWTDVWERGAPAWFLQAGQYTMTPDHRPLIGETEVAGLFVNTGYSGHGVMASPAGSRILADVMAGTLTADRNAFLPDRRFGTRDLDTL